MKKLALALVCLMGVAFFTSCDPTNVVENPEPTIAVLAGDGYLQDGQVMDLNVEYPFGFIAASNPETQEPLAKLVITVGDDVICDSTISGTEFKYENALYFELAEREIIDTVEIKATVTDAAGEKKSASITAYINYEEGLEAYPFEWVRANGADGTGLEAFGLKWTRNEKEVFAVIEPIEGATLYSVPSEKWDEVQTESDLAALFSDGGGASVIKDYRGVSMAATHDYDDVIATLYDDVYYLIHITKCKVEQRYYVFTITGEFK